MHGVALNAWMEQFKARFDERELKYMTVQKVKIYLQLKDTETGQLHFHQIEYQNKDKENLNPGPMPAEEETL